MKISVIVPTLNEELSVAATLKALCRLPAVAEVIVVDGGSNDKTLETAQKFGAKIVKSKPGRGLQLAAGANAANSGVCCFLHVDTLPAIDADKQILASLRV